MKIGVISDTHLEVSTRTLAEVNEKHFSDVDLILHAGDIKSPEVLHAFDGKELIAVSGNNDSEEIRSVLPTKEIIPAGQFKIGLTHGWGSPIGLRKRIAPSFEGVDCLVYGHSHWAVNKRWNGILYFNPGAFTNNLTSLWRPSIGILTVDHDIRGRIIRV